MGFKWLKHYMPKGLYGRAAMILLLPVVSLQLIVSLVFIQRHYEGVTERMTDTFVRELIFIFNEMDQGRDPDGLADAFNLSLAAVPLDQALNGRRFYDLPGRVIERQLSAAFPSFHAIDLLKRQTVALTFDRQGEGLEVTVNRARLTASNPHQLIVIMLFFGTLLTLIAYFFLRNQLRPIKRMAAAASAFGKGRVVDFSPAGAVELRAAGQAFLDMRNRIERQNQSRSLMLSGISHDLRTPLTRLRLGLSMLEDEVDVGPMLRDVQDLDHLVEAFLDYARDEASEQPDEMDAASLLQDIVAEAVGRGEPVFLRSVSGDEPLVSLRPLATRRALENLIANGLRYGKEVYLSLEIGRRSVRFRVEDSGPGIPEERVEEALRPFSRLDPARNQNKGSGIGLGLAIVSDIARSHGGQLRLSQSVDFGGLCADLVLAR